MDFTLTLRHSRRRLCAIVAALCCAVVMNASDKVGDLYYDFNTSSLTATVTYESSSSSSNYPSLTEVVIPATVQFNGVDYKVTAIGISAFSGCALLSSVAIGANIESIEQNAFYECSANIFIIPDAGNLKSLNACRIFPNAAFLFPIV